MSLHVQGTRACHAERGQCAPIASVTQICQSKWSICKLMMMPFPSRKQVADRDAVPLTCHCIVKVCLRRVAGVGLPKNNQPLPMATIGSPPPAGIPGQWSPCWGRSAGPIHANIQAEVPADRPQPPCRHRFTDSSSQRDSPPPPPGPPAPPFLPRIGLIRPIGPISPIGPIALPRRRERDRARQ